MRQAMRNQLTAFAALFQNLAHLYQEPGAHSAPITAGRH